MTVGFAPRVCHNHTYTWFLAIRTFIPFTSAGVRTGLVAVSCRKPASRMASARMFLLWSLLSHSFTQGDVS